MKFRLYNTRTSVLLFLCLLPVILSGCLTPPGEPQSFDDIAEPIASQGWITFKGAAKVNPETLFQDYAEFFQLSPGTDMVIQSTEKDDLGWNLYRYQQFYRDILVEHAQFLVHAPENYATSANGELEPNFTPPVTEPVLSMEDAQRIMLEAMPSGIQYLHEDKFADELAADPGSLDPAYLPVGILLYTEQPETQERVLAWMFKAYTTPAGESQQIYIDASTGALIKSLPLMLECFPGGGTTTFNGAQPFNTARQDIPGAGEQFVLVDNCRPAQLKMLRTAAINGTNHYFDSDNNWNDQGTPEVTSFWALGIAFDYFDLVHGRKSFDGKNGAMLIQNDPTKGNGAWGTNGVITIGPGPTNASSDDYNSTDIVGHEFTHSLIEQTAQLSADETKESAALNESFSDIFGQLVERWETQNANPDWIVGDDKGCTGSLICRDLEDPEATGGPDTYQGNYWQTMNIDPHVNGSVQNRWFYLITDGGTGTNPELKGNQNYNITGLGITKARRIVYRTLTTYLTAASDYADARDGSIQAAADLYGYNSGEQVTVINAWCAVGLCPAGTPTAADRFDQPNGNPNPVSPDNNNTYAGATPIGRGRQPVVALAPDTFPWSADSKPQLQISDLSIYPLNDVDYFNIQLPEFDPLEGRCATSGISFLFDNPVNARTFVDGQVYSTSRNSGFMRISIPQTGELVLEVSAPFPGQVLAYNLKIAYYIHIDGDCIQTEPRSKWELIQDCIMCDLGILRGVDSVILEPFYRQQDLVSAQDHFFFWQGGQALEIPIRFLQGNGLHVEMLNDNGEVITSADWDGTAQEFLLQAPELPLGVYSLRFSDYGNGTAIEVITPGQ